DKQSHVVVSKEVIPEIKSAHIMFHGWKMSKAGIINKGFMKMIGLKKSSKHRKVEVLKVNGDKHTRITTSYYLLASYILKHRACSSRERVQPLHCRTKGAWDAVVTCFSFIQPKILLNTLKSSQKFLKMGEKCQLSLENVKGIAIHYVEKTIETTYTTNPRSTMQEERLVEVESRPDSVLDDFQSCDRDDNGSIEEAKTFPV
nr:carnosine N-methyltransferase-like isoform X1 [Tanacetum cinerariifolium]GEX92793.1 carnosine N-methyltransferase-like isoform X1 [Tanacetum cinerariifolium]